MTERTPDPLRDLLARYLVGGDEEALEDFVRATKPRLLAVARRIGAPQDAEDAVQSAYLSLLRMRGDGLDAPPLPWLVTAVVRIAYRRKAVQNRQAEIARRLAKPREEPLPLEAALAGERDEVLKAVIARLPDRYRDPLVLRHLEGLSVAEIGTLLDVPEATVRTRIHRATRLVESRFPRALLFGLLLPWWLVERPWLSAGGLLLPKKAVAVAAVLLLVAVGTLMSVRPWERGEPADGPTTAAVVASTQEIVGDVEPDRAPVLAGQAEAPAVRTPLAATTKVPFFGRVFEPSGAAVAGARVEIRGLYQKHGAQEHLRASPPPNPHRGETTTDAAGSFGLPLPPYEDERVVAVELHVIAKGWPTIVAKARRDEETTVTLEAGGSVHLRVLFEGRPVEAADVHLVRGSDALPTHPRMTFPTFQQAATGSDGRVAFRVPAGAYRARVRADARAPRDTDVVDVAAGETETVEMVLTRGIVATVRLLDPEGAPVPDAEVVVGGPLGVVRTGRTGANGTCVLEGFAAPRKDAEHWESCLFWRAFATAFAPFQSYLRVPPAEAAVLLEHRLVRGVPIRLRFLDGGGDPIPGVRAVLEMDRNGQNPLGGIHQPEFVSGPDGRMLLPHLGNQWEPWKLHARTPEPGREHKTVHLEPPASGEAPAEQTVVMTSRTATLAGRVLRPDGEPATGGRVGWLPGDARFPGALSFAESLSAIERDGGFRMDRVAAGPGSAVVTLEGFVPQAVAVDPRAFQTGEVVSLRVLELGKIFGGVLARDGGPVEGATVTLWQQVQAPKERGIQTMSVATTRTDAEGRFVFRGAGDEKYTIGVEKEDLTRSLPWPREVRASDEELRLVMKPASEGSGMALVVRVTAGGRPYDGKLDVNWKYGGGNAGAGDPTRDGEGRYVFRVWTDPGAYDFDFYAAGYRPFHAKGIVLEDRPGNPVVDVAFDRGAALRLRVRDVAGEPLRSQWVSVGGQAVQTDDEGECEVGGYLAGTENIRVVLQADPGYTGASLEGVAVPGTAEVTLRRFGFVRARILRGKDLRTDVLLKALSADGALVDEEVVNVARWNERPEVQGSLQITQEGTYRIEAALGTEVRDAQVHATPGLHSEVTFDFR